MAQVEAANGFGGLKLLSVGSEREQPFTGFNRGCERTWKATLSKLRARKPYCRTAGTVTVVARGPFVLEVLERLMLGRQWSHRSVTAECKNEVNF